MKMVKLPQVAPRGAAVSSPPPPQKLPPAKLINTYQIRVTKLHFTLASFTIGFTHIGIEPTIQYISGLEPRV